jgi:hypothetical protein
MALCWPAMPTEVKFAADSLLERTGFELAVPPRRRDGQCYGVRSLKRCLDLRGMTSGTARNGLRFQLVLRRKHSMRPTAQSGRVGCGGPCPKVHVYQRR